MCKLKLQMQLTIDGFVAGPNGEMDWMTFPWTDDIEKYVAELTASIDTILLGRKLAEGFIPHWANVAADPKNQEQQAGILFSETPKIVFTKTLEKSPWINTKLAKSDLIEEIKNIKNKEGNDIIVYGGGTFVSALLHAGLIDELHLFINPAAIGKGMSIFQESEMYQQFNLVKSQAFDCGIVVLNYTLKKSVADTTTKQGDKQGDIILERLFAAPIDLVWQAITVKELMKEWYFDLKDFKAEKGFKFQFTGGPSPERQYLHLCEIIEVIPGRKLVHSWRYDGYAGNSLVAYELIERGDQTLLRFSHTGIDTLAVENPDFTITNFQQGWDHIIHTSLLDFLMKKTATL